MYVTHTRGGRARLSAGFVGSCAGGSIQTTLAPAARSNPCATRRCTSEIAFQLRTSRLGAFVRTVPVSKGTVFYGRTSQSSGTRRFPMFLQTDATGRRVVRTVFEYKTCCSRGIPGLTTIDFGPGTAIQGRRFARIQRFTLSLGDGITERYFVEVKGRFEADGVRGTVQMLSSIRSRGRTIARCKLGSPSSSGIRKFHLRP